MLTDWFYSTEIWITLPLFVGGFVALSCLVVIGLRPVIRKLVDDPREWDHALAHVIGTFGVFFGILLALVAVSVYENFADTRVSTLEEAAQLTALYRGTTGLPQDAGAPMRETIQEYVHTVVDQDFPSQRRGILPEGSAVLVDDLERLLHDYEPADLQQQAEFIQLLATFDDFIESRRARIDATSLELPPPFWLVIWVGAAVNAVLIGFIHVKKVGLHLLIAGLLALFVGLVIFVTADMDHPYQGSISVGPGAFERVLQQTIDRLGSEP
ncbi:DUF4239 domain-containing protein [Agromyces sp. Soil535]|uniref:bestrophin-like domain n=1 Tax=Agromyces sp. Soil535 TaxID=1736390 RepID=UPI0006F1E629|nr:DUF4239 domain-containing protein [Agromyces sp. Soil535]KRE30404.1 hypothetical protein ASG80_16730 [Agromyces sp. Soil535]